MASLDRRERYNLSYPLLFGALISIVVGYRWAYQVEGKAFVTTGRLRETSDLVIGLPLVIGFTFGSVFVVIFLIQKFGKVNIFSESKNSAICPQCKNVHVIGEKKCNCGEDPEPLRNWKWYDKSN